ncbi:MAG: IS630 family transposase [Microvirga sp.]
MAPWLRDSPALPCSAGEHGRSMPLEFPARLKAVTQTAGGKPIEIWFADEARVGQKNKITRRWAKRGTRPSAPKDQRTSSAYIFGAICPAEGKGAALVLPRCTSEAMTLHLAEISHAVAPGAHAVVLLDQAGWHLSKRLVIPANITLVPLPAKAPELNPVENVWQFLRENWLLRDNLSEMSATITMVICSRGGLMIVALRQRMQGLSWLSPSVNQDDVLIVARVGGRPGPRLRSIAVRRR